MHQKEVGKFLSIPEVMGKLKELEKGNNHHWYSLKIMYVFQSNPCIPLILQK